MKFWISSSIPFLFLFEIESTLGATVAADNALYVQYLGRTRKPGDGSVRYDWNGVEARIIVSNATSLFVNINATISTTSTTRVRIYVEDQGNSYPVSYIFLTPAITHYLAATGLGGVTRMIRMVEIEEPPYMHATTNQDIRFITFETDGMFEPITSRGLSRSLVFVGDSITAATNIIAFPPCGDAGFQSDYTLSYSSLLCSNFTANCSNIAIGGKGLVANCCDNGPTMTSYFLQTEYGTVKPDWDFAQEPIPDGIIINLGTNDFSQNSGSAFEATFTQGYVDFMVNITNYYQSKKNCILLWSWTYDAIVFECDLSCSQSS